MHPVVPFSCSSHPGQRLVCSVTNGDLQVLCSCSRTRVVIQHFLNVIQSNKFHVLLSLFSPLAQHKYSLQRSVHSFMLPCKDNKNFISRVLQRHCSELI